MNYYDSKEIYNFLKLSPFYKDCPHYGCRDTCLFCIWGQVSTTVSWWVRHLSCFQCFTQVRSSGLRLLSFQQTFKEVKCFLWHFSVFWWEHGCRLHLVFREKCKRKGNHAAICLAPGDLALRCAAQIMSMLPYSPHQIKVVLACTDRFYMVKTCTTLAATATCLELHGLCRDFFLYQTLSELLQVRTRRHFSRTPGRSVTHPLQVVVCCQNCCKKIRNWDRWGLWCNTNSSFILRIHVQDTSHQPK